MIPQYKVSMEILRLIGWYLYKLWTIWKARKTNQCELRYNLYRWQFKQLLFNIYM